ncbi:MAG TPA: peroxiredoxin-like family protein, partial [Hyphomicrobium sp.]
MHGSLNDRLAAYVAKMRELKIPFAEANDELVARLKATDVGTLAPTVGDIMPPFMLPSHDRKLISLEEMLAKGPTVISLNRGHWCPFCRIAIGELATMHDAIKASGAEVVSIMPETQKFTRQLSEAEASLMILSDVDNGYALSLGLVFWVGDRIKSLMRDYDIHLDEFQGNDGWFLPVAATFVVGQDGRVLARCVDADFRKRMEVDEILTAL